MITVLRTKFKTSGMTYIVWISLVSMFIGSVFPSLFKKNSCEPWAMKINGSSIPYRTFAQEVQKNIAYINHIRAQYGQFADYFLYSMGVQDAQSLTFKQLITQELLVQVMQKAGMIISPDYIAYKLHDPEFVMQHCSDIIPAHIVHKENGIDSNALRIYLQNHNIPVESFQKQLQAKIQQAFAHEMLTTFSYVPDYVKTYKELQKTGQKTYSVLNIKHDSFLQEVQKTPVTDAEIQHFFDRENTRSKRYVVPEKRSGVVWEFSPKDYGIVIDTEVIEKYYDEHKTTHYVAQPPQIHIRQLVINFTPDTKNTAWNTIQSLHDTLTADKTQFASLAKEYSTDTESASRGGEISPFSRGQKEPALDRAAFTLKQDGDISSILELDNRFVIIQRIEKKAQTYKPLQEVISIIEQELVAKEFNKLFIREAKELLDMPEESRVQKFIEAHRGTKKLLTRVSQSPEEKIQALFDLKESEYAFRMEGQKGIIVRLDTIEKAYTPTLDTIKKVVTQDVYQERATERMGQKIEQLKKEAEEKPLAIVAAANTISLETLKNLSQQDGAGMQRARSLGIDPQMILHMEKIGSWNIQDNGFDRYLIRLEEITTSPSIADKSAANNIKKQVEQEQTNAFIGSFIASLYRDATIDINNTITTITEENSI